MGWVKSWRVPGSGTTDYTVSYSDDGYYGCDCPAWKFQNRPFAGRNECKHIAGVLRSIDDGDGPIPIDRYPAEAAKERVADKRKERVATLDGLAALKMKAKWSVV